MPRFWPCHALPFVRSAKAPNAHLMNEERAPVAAHRHLAVGVGERFVALTVLCRRAAPRSPDATQPSISPGL